MEEAQKVNSQTGASIGGAPAPQIVAISNPVNIKLAAKPGWQTTEFWMAIIVKLYIIVMSAHGAIPASLAALLLGILTGIYIIGRSIVKRINPNVVIPDLPQGGV